MKMSSRAVILLLIGACVSGCAVIGRGVCPRDAVECLRELDKELAEAERMWAGAIDDPWTEPELRKRYFRMQDLCRECARRESGFTSVEEKELCDRVKSPFVVYFNGLRVEVNKLKEQLFYVDLEEHLFKPGSVAYEYEKRPSSENLEKLRNVFDRVHRYLDDRDSSWTRYINKYKFQKSRLEHFRREFLDRDREYRELRGKQDVNKDDLKFARLRADFAFHRLKKEYVTNDLPPAGEVNAFYMAESLADYHRLIEREREIDEQRKKEGRRKEVVIFVYGLSEGRGSWGRFPELLSQEDRANPETTDKYFKVYVFSFDTTEEYKSVEKFKDELKGFISDIIRDEKVERVHLVGHSLGAVLCLKYILHEADELLTGVDDSQPELVAETLLDAYGNGKIHRTVKSFTSIAGSLSGSEIANIAAEQFIPKERLFSRRLPLFRTGIPGYGDIQVRENQIGSKLNLTSFRRLDIECPLAPKDLVRFLKGSQNQISPSAYRSLVAGTIPSLCIIGDPIKVHSLFRKSGLLKIKRLWKIIHFQGYKTALRSFRREEDDGFVKSYSANLNHNYLLESDVNIGYKEASVRCTDFGHFGICYVESRRHPTYRYVVSFLGGNLLPQMEEGRYRLRQFATFIRVFPAGIDSRENARAHFMPEARIVYLKDRKLVLPPLVLEELPAGDILEGENTRNVSFEKPLWNKVTGVRFCEGRIIDPSQHACVAYRIKADGYRDRIVGVPVSPGEVSYAVNIVLERDERLE